MILTIMLLVILFILTLFMIFTVGTGGLMFLLLFGDILIFILLIGYLVIKKIKR